MSKKTVNKKKKQHSGKKKQINPKKSANTSSEKIDENHAVRLHQNGQIREAAKLYEQILSHDPQNVTCLHMLGVVFYQSGKYPQAEEYIKKALELYPGWAEAWNNLGSVYNSQGYRDKFVECTQKGVELKPNFAQGHYNLGVALKDSDRFDEAIQAYQKSIQLNPNFAPAWNNLGFIYLERNEYEQALEKFDKAVEIKPDYAEARNNRGIALKRLERTEEALQEFERALKQKPDYAEAYNNLGNACCELDDYEQAIEYCHKALELYPNYAEANYNLGKAYYKQNEYKKAARCFQKAVDINPEYASAYNHLGFTLKELQSFQKAEEAYFKALEVEPEFADVFMNLGILYNETRRFEEAEQRFLQVLEYNPNYAEAMNSLGNVLKNVGRIQEAENWYRSALEVNPNIARPWWNMASMKKFSSDDPDVQEMLALLDKEDELPWLQRMNLHFALAKAYEDIQDFDTSFYHYKQANDLQFADLDYDVSIDEQFFSEIARIFTKELLDEFTGTGLQTDVPIFILGMPRSGTTLLEQILASHPQVCGAGELNILNEMVNNVQGSDGKPYGFPYFVKPMRGKEYRHFGQYYLDRMKNFATEDTPRITDKMPANFRYLGLIRLILPRAKIIHIYRDPVDTCLSCYQKNFTYGQYWSYNLEYLGRYYQAYRKLMEHWREVLPGRFMEIEYEQIIDNPETSVRQVLDYCDLPWDDRCMEFHKTERNILTASNLQVRQPIYKSAVQRWRNYEKHLGPLLEALGSYAPES